MKHEKQVVTKTSLTFFLMLVTGVIIFLRGSVTAEFNSSNGILSWGDPIFVSTTSTNGAVVPIIDRAPDGTIMIVYNHSTAGGFVLPYFVQSSGNGNSWSTPSPVRGGTTDILNPTFTFDNNSGAHAVWRTGSDIFYSAESNWPTAGTSIATTLGLIEWPDIDIANDGTIHVVWAQADPGMQANIYHAYSQSGGAGWTISPPLATNSRRSLNPTISIDNSNNVHIAWVERTEVVPVFKTEIQYKKGTWAGNTLTFDAMAEPISDPNDDQNYKPDIVATNDGQVHVSYSRGALNETSDQYPMYAQYNGTVWLPPVDITNNNPVSVNQDAPFFLKTTIDACNGIVYIYYHGALSPTAKEQILGHNSGDNFAFREEVTAPDTRNFNPSLACQDSQKFLAFERKEETGPNAGTSQIYFIGYTGGGSFLPAIYRN